QGIYPGMSLADARALISHLQYFDNEPGRADILLHGIAEWCIRFTPSVAIDPPNGLILDVTGCAHLWKGEKQYLADIYKRIKGFGYDIRIAIADTIGTAWAMARYGINSPIVESGQQTKALLSLPPAALRLQTEITDRLEKLGLRQMSHFISMPRASLRRRFGSDLLKRMDQAVGTQEEFIQSILPVEPWQERLPCLEPIVTATGIEIALERLLTLLCKRLKKDQKGLRKALLKCYRIDGKSEQIQIATNRASCNDRHLFRLFELNIKLIAPGPGIELFILDAPVVEDLSITQEELWASTDGLENIVLAELLDRLAGKFGDHCIRRFVPDEHYWPERAFKPATSLKESISIEWKTDLPRPVDLLTSPHPIIVTAPVPDYPPMNFRYNGKLHTVIKSDGPERIEQEWWLQEGQHRDYYCLEDETGSRYWVFRSGHYDTAKNYQWFIHGFFA
ncbi:MAG: DNA polymerase Y family protein, partial [Ferruginibacter sp.]